MVSLPTDKDYKEISHKMSEILLPNERALNRIDGLVSFGLRISKQDWKQIKMYFMLSNRLNINEQAIAIQHIIMLPGITTNNIEFDNEAKETMGHAAFKGQHVRADKPR